jgi:hypothetical protein
MLGKVALEEAYEHSGLAEKSMRDTSLYITPRDRERYVLQIHDITGGNVSDYPTNMVSGIQSPPWPSLGSRALRIKPWRKRQRL